MSASFVVYILAGAFLGPASAFVAAVISELAATRVIRTRRAAFLFNLVAAGFAALLAGTLIRDLAPHDQTADFYLVLAALALAMLELTWLIIAPFYIAYDGYSAVWNPRTLIEHLPSALITVALTVAGAAIYVEVGLGGIAFALAAVIAFSYMAHLLDNSRQRAEQYVSLSWGVLAGLLRALDTRDQRAARHAAAVARFSSDMAEALGMSENDQELAHTAGLLHDIGHFALSDRVAERGRTLTEEDWVAIQQHPELGADMLRDLGMYGPIAEIVLAHHERIDGRGYPYGLSGDEIPTIAKIIAVAEVYDTLTAADTYRTRKSSFEALRELRRVAGTQLDSRIRRGARRAAELARASNTGMPTRRTSTPSSTWNAGSSRPGPAEIDHRESAIATPVQPRPASDAAPVKKLADEAFLRLALTSTALLQRLQELLDLLNAEAPLSSRCPVRL